MKRVMVLFLVACITMAAKRAYYDPALPKLGTRFGELPAGEGKTEVEGACFRCHSSDMLLQQRLTEKQWTATVEKMMRWGAAVDEKQKPLIIAYLAKHFGPQNKYTPRKTRPVGY